MLSTALARHPAADAILMTGDLSQDPAPDDHADELSRLRDLVDLATGRLRQARASRDRLVADAAHELRTPLTTLRMEVDLALRRERPRG